MTRLLEVDRLKGVAIVGVMLIHARPLVDTAFYDLFIARSAQIFIVLFGLNSYLWWQQRASMSVPARMIEWYVSRFWRLMPPVWGMLALWWPLQLALWGARLTELRFLVATMLGYLPWIGGGWFVSAILTLAITYPLFLACFALLEPALACALGMAATVLSGVYQTRIIDLMRDLLRDSVPFSHGFYLWLFPPVFAWHLAAGGYVAQRWTRERNRIAAMAVALGATLLVLIAAVGASPYLKHAFQMLLDVPVAVVSLWGLAWIPDLGFLDRLLGWLGARSWGLYLGQLVVHNAFWLAGYRAYEGTPLQRWIYFLVLLGGAIALTEVGRRMWRQVPFGARFEKDVVT